jgi:hypothetical protein
VVGVAVVVADGRTSVGAAVAVVAVQVGAAVRVGAAVAARCSSGRRGAGGLDADARLTERKRTDLASFNATAPAASQVRRDPPPDVQWAGPQLKIDPS